MQRLFSLFRRREVHPPASRNVSFSATKPVFTKKTTFQDQSLTTRPREKSPLPSPVTTRPAVYSTNLQPGISHPYSDKSRLYHSQEVGRSKMSAVHTRQQRRHLGRGDFPNGVNRLEMNLCKLTSPQKISSGLPYCCDIRRKNLRAGKYKDHTLICNVPCQKLIQMVHAMMRR